jgi:hypothetical protein
MDLDEARRGVENSESPTVLRKATLELINLVGTLEKKVDDLEGRLRALEPPTTHEENVARLMAGKSDPRD